MEASRVGDEVKLMGDNGSVSSCQISDILFLGRRNVCKMLDGG